MSRPSRHDAENAIRTLLAWTGDDAEREGLQETPKRVVNAFEEYCSGYQLDPAAYLAKTFEDVGGYDEIILLRDIPFCSLCEHHLAPFVGRAHIAYLPNKRVVGISKLARVVENYARRLQIQEKLTSEIARCIDTVLQPQGCLVVMEANHHCMTTRGVNKHGMSMVTAYPTGVFKVDLNWRQDTIKLLLDK